MGIDSPLNGRPLDQYAVNKKSIACLVPTNAYDKNEYAECSYIGNRTLMKCRQIRRKDTLLLNRGICEQHAVLSKSLRKRNLKERHRMELEGQRKSKYRKVLHAPDYVSEEDEYLLPCAEWRAPKIEYGFESMPLDDQMGFQGFDVFTDKEALKEKINLMKEEINQLKIYREACQERAHRTAEVKLGGRCSKKKLEADQLTEFVSNACYQSKNLPVKRMEFLKRGIKKTFVPCVYGVRTETPEEDAAVVLYSIVDKLSHSDKKFEPFDETQCKRPSIPGSVHCLPHSKIKFKRCDRCSNVVLTEDDGLALCIVHLKEQLYNVGPSFVGLPVASTKKPSDLPPRMFDFTDTEEDDDDLNLDISRVMKSNTTNRNRNGPFHYSKVLSPLSPAGSVASMAQINFNKARQKKMKEDESCSAARCRPFQPAEFHRERIAVKPIRTQIPKAMLPSPRMAGRSAISFNAQQPTGTRPLNMPQIVKPRGQSISQGRISYGSQRIIYPQRQQEMSMNNPTVASFTNRFPPRENVQKRKQLEEDQKAAASLADTLQEDELVEDVDDHHEYKQVTPSVSHTFGTGGPAPRYSVKSQSFHGPSYDNRRSAQGTPLHPGRDIYRVQQVTMNRPGRRGYSTVNAHLRPPQNRQYHMPPLDLKDIPASMQDKPLGEVLKSYTTFDKSVPGTSYSTSTQRPPVVSTRPAYTDNMGLMLRNPDGISSQPHIRPIPPGRPLPAAPHRMIKPPMVARPAVPPSAPRPTAPPMPTNPNRFSVVDTSPPRVPVQQRPRSPPKSQPRPQSRGEPTTSRRESLVLPSAFALPPPPPMPNLAPILTQANAAAQSALEAKNPPKTKTPPIPITGVNDRVTVRTTPRRSSRLEKAPSTSEETEKNPLSLLADEAIRSDERPSNSTDAADEEEYEEEL